MYALRNDELLEHIVEELVSHFYPAMSLVNRRIVMRSLTRKRSVKRAVLLHEGETAGELFFVGRGLIKTFYKKENKEIVTAFTCEGGVVLNAESLMRQEPSKLNIVTLEPSIVYSWPYERILELSEQERDIRMFYRRIVEWLLANLQADQTTWRFESALERYKHFLKTQPDVARRAPLNDIASFLAMAPETLSRMRAQIREER